MSKFLTHEGLASNVLNNHFCSASGVTQPWQQWLTNNDSLLELIVERMGSDWLALSPKMRKAWNGTTLDPQHP